VRSKLSHPVIDADGHWMEPTEVLIDYIERIGGTDAADAYLAFHKKINDWYSLSRDERMRLRFQRIPWWGGPAGTLDKATSMLPELLNRRLDEFGIDYALISGSRFGPGMGMPDPKIRKIWARAINVLNAELFADYSDRITTSAVVPMDTPEEAIEELEYAVTQLGFKYALIASVRRPVEAAGNYSADIMAPRPYYIDTFGIDSPYDYDPVWAKFVELKVAPCTHSGSIGWVDRTSPSNFTYNHIGHFAAAAHAVAKSLFMGGVTRRFPTLKFGFLECGAGWARNLSVDLAGHWSKRNAETMMTHYAPNTTDLDQLAELIELHGGPSLQGRSQSVISQPDQTFPGVGAEELTTRELATLDEFAALGVSSKKELIAEFVKNFWVGCEADDPMTMLAFDPRFGPKLKAMFGSDISHFDVIDMTEVLEEAYEMVEYGWIDEQEFREFTFENVVGLHAGMNPDFFKGTAVEDAASAEIARQRSAPNGA
jgi:predicted TIM-barrel fold metal-dependent hydrolase